MQPDTIIRHYPSANLFYAIQANTEEALKAFYQQEYPKVQQYILKNKGSAEQAKDIFQEAFITVWRNVQLKKFQPQSETALAGYLYQVAKNKWIDYLRSGYHKKIMNVNNIQHAFDVPDDLPAEEQEYMDDVKKGLQQLGKDCQEILNRFYYQNETMQTIAAAKNWTEATARNNKYRCMERLREILKKNKSN